MTHTQKTTHHCDSASEPTPKPFHNNGPRGPEATAKKALSISEFCRSYSVGRTSAFDLIRSGALKAKKTGTRTIILVEDAERWCKALPSAGMASVALNSNNGGNHA